MDNLHSYLLIILNAQTKAIENFQTMLACLPGHVYLKDTHGVYLWCNQEQARDLNFDSCDNLIGKTDYDFSEKSLADQFTRIDQTVIQEKKDIEVEERIVKNGLEAITLTRKIPIYDKNNQVIGVLGTSFDITDRKKMEEDLRIAKKAAEAANHAKTEFIANMGHDIRTPLTGIIGMSYILEDEVQRPDEKAHATIIHQSGEQLLSLLNGVLDLITIDATNEETVLHESFDVRRVIHDVMELERSAVEARHLSIEMHIDEAMPPYVVGDKMKLHRILLNLAGNAIKFTKEGHIEINAQLLSIEDNEANILFSVKDTGIGIPDELQDKVFDRFFKVSPSYKGLYTGNGIGLHIVQKYVNLMGGTIRLASAVGVGTTFSFMLSMKIGQPSAAALDDISVDQLSLTIAPTKTKTKPLAQAAIPHPQSIINPHQLQVLLVEDNAPALNVLKFLVKKFDVQVSTAVDAELALELVKTQPFDLIITDLGLPGLSGDEMTAVIRAYERDHHLKPMAIVGLTGHALGDITQTCLNAGMNEVYRKPMPPESLKKLIEALLMRKRESFIEPPNSGGALGTDLPDTETELFEMNKYPLVDMQVAIQILGSDEMARDIFNDLKEQGISADLAIIQKAHDRCDWKTVENYTHKIKGGACYGTVRLYYALLYMERYLKSGQTHCSDALYAQMLRVIDETMAYLDTL